MSNTQQLDGLAREIAQGLGEEEYLPVYQRLVRRYPEGLVRRAYEKTLEVPAEKIRKSKGAIFNYLLKQYARKKRLDDPDSSH
jgi:hypothetical protein